MPKLNEYFSENDIHIEPTVFFFASIIKEQLKEIESEKDLSEGVIRFILDK